MLLPPWGFQCKTGTPCVLPGTPYIMRRNSTFPTFLWGCPLFTAQFDWFVGVKENVPETGFLSFSPTTSGIYTEDVVSFLVIRNIYIRDSILRCLQFDFFTLVRIWCELKHFFLSVFLNCAVDCVLFQWQCKLIFILG